MPRQRSPERDRAFSIYAETNGNIANREIANQLELSEKTVSGWKAKDKWAEKLNGVLHINNRSTPNKSKPSKVKKRVARGAEKEVPETPVLTDKQAIFVEEYLIDFNATRAAMASGYSKDTAYSIGSENLRKPEVQSAIQDRTKSKMSSLGITQQRVLLEYLKIAFADITNYVEFGHREAPVIGMDGPVRDANGEVMKETVAYVTIKDSSNVDGTLIHEVKQSRDGVSVKLHDKLKALEALSKYLDLLPDHHKRLIEQEKLKMEHEEQLLRIEKMKAEIDRMQNPDGGETEDDGFLDALHAEAGAVWGGDDSDDDPDEK